MGFYDYESNDPTNNVKALKEDRVLRIRLQSHQVHPTVRTITQLCSMKQKHTKYTQINTNKSMQAMLKYYSTTITIILQNSCNILNVSYCVTKDSKF